MGKSSSAPKPPDPKQTAAAQTSTNIGTAIANGYLGAVNQNTPYGSLEYSFEGGGNVPQVVAVGGQKQAVNGGGITGKLFGGESDKNISYRTTPKSWRVGDQTFNTRADAVAYQQGLQAEQGGYNWTDPYTGKTYNLPKTTVTQTLSPEEQRKLELNQQTEINLGELAQDQSAFLKDYMANPFSYGVGEHESWASGLYDELNRDANSRANEDLATRLANQGITPGSEAYSSAIGGLRENQMNTRNQFLLDSYNTGMNTALANRNQPINEITALLSGSQVSHPNFAQTNSPRAATTDVAGIINNNYQQELAGWQQQQANQNRLMGGLFGLGASAIRGGVF